MFSRSIVSHSLGPHGLQHAKPPCPSPSTELVQTHVHRVLPSIFPRIRVFSNELALCIRWPKYWSFSFSPSNEYSGLISFRMDQFDLLEVQWTLKRLLLGHTCPEKCLLLADLQFRSPQCPGLLPGPGAAQARAGKAGLQPGSSFISSGTHVWLGHRETTPALHSDSGRCWLASRQGGAPGCVRLSSRNLPLTSHPEVAGPNDFD